MEEVMGKLAKKDKIKKDELKDEFKESLSRIEKETEMKLALADVNGTEEIERIASKVKIPEFSVENPFVLKAKDDPSVASINTPRLGLVADANPYRNQTKNALKDAEARGCDAVVVTGNLCYIDTKRFSNLTALRSRLSGVKTKPEFTEDKNAAEKLGKGEPVFLSFKEKFDLVLEEVRTAFTNNGKPIFHGPVLICFGMVEESLAIYYANEKMNKAVAEARYKQQGFIKSLKLLKKKEKKEREKESIESQIINAEKKLKLIKGTSLNTEFTNKCRDEMTRYIIFRLEQIIPNAKIISVGEVGIIVDSSKGINRNLIEIVPKPTESIHDTFFGDFMDEKYQAIAGGAIPQPAISLISGLNLDQKVQCIDYPTVLKKETADVNSGSVYVIQLPTCIDGNFVKQVKQQNVRYSDPLIKFASSEGFSSGSIVLGWVDGILTIDHLSQGYLSNSSIFARKEVLPRLFKEDNVFYGEQEGDMHIGHPFVAKYRLPGFPYELYHFQLVHKLLLKGKAPIVFYVNTGDITNSQNYATWNEIPPEKKYPAKWLKFMADLNGKKLPAKEKLRMLSKEIVKDVRLGGVISPEVQLKEYFRSAVESDFDDKDSVVGLEYWARMLRRAKRIGLKTFGQFGLITFIEGNHSLHTFEGKIHESTQIATHLGIALRRRGFSEEELEGMLKAPLFGSYPLAEGLVGIAPNIATEKEAIGSGDKPYFYCLIAQHKPAAGRGIYRGKDKARSIKLHQARKGTIQAYQQKRFIVRLGGDIHLLVMAFSKNTLDVVSGSQTFYDSWRAYLGLALNNIVTVILGLPKDGPHTGSIRTTFFRYGDLLEYVRKPRSINFRKLFRNAMGRD